MAFFKTTRTTTITNPPVTDYDPDPLDLGAQSGEPSSAGSLGLDALSDDQLLDLGEQARMEIWSRGFVLFQKIWMASVARQDAEFTDRKEAWIEAQVTVRQSRYNALVADAEKKLQQAAREGLIKIFTPAEEKLIGECVSLQAKLGMIDAFRLKTLEQVQAARAAGSMPAATLQQGGRSSAGSAAYPSAYGGYGPRK